MDPFTPLNIDLKGRRCLVVGGGKVAEGKVKTLLAGGAEVFVVSPVLCPGLRELFFAGKINCLDEPYSPSSLKGMFLVICATPDGRVNRHVAADCRRRGILVNCAGGPGEGTFFFPAVLTRGALKVAVSTAGGSPALAARVRDQIAAFLEPSLASFSLLLKELRPRVIGTVPHPQKRKELLQYLAGKECQKLFESRGRAGVEGLVDSLIKEHTGEEGPLQC